MATASTKRCHEGGFCDICSAAHAAVTFAAADAGAIRVASATGLKQGAAAISALRGAPPRRSQRDLTNQFVDHGLAEGFEILRDHDEGAWAANDVAFVIFTQPAGWIGVFSIPGKWRRAQYDQSVNGDPLGESLVARRGHLTPAVVRPIAGYVDRPPRSRERCALELLDRKIDASADRSAVG